jgi:hypothetical protein
MKVFYITGHANFFDGKKAKPTLRKYLIAVGKLDLGIRLYLVNKS